MTAVAADPCIDTRISIALAAAMLVQSALALMWVGAAAERLQQLERRADVSAEMIERTARLEEQLAAVRESLSRIEEKFDVQFAE